MGGGGGFCCVFSGSLWSCDRCGSRELLGSDTCVCVGNCEVLTPVGVGNCEEVTPVGVGNCEVVDTCGCEEL